MPPRGGRARRPGPSPAAPVAAAPVPRPLRGLLARHAPAIAVPARTETGPSGLVGDGANAGGRAATPPTLERQASPRSETAPRSDCGWAVRTPSRAAVRAELPTHTASPPLPFPGRRRREAWPAGSRRRSEPERAELTHRERTSRDLSATSRPPRRGPDGSGDTCLVRETRSDAQRIRRVPVNGQPRSSRSGPGEGSPRSREVHHRRRAGRRPPRRTRAETRHPVPLTVLASR
jgi:hypothetical protein